MIGRSATPRDFIANSVWALLACFFSPVKTVRMRTVEFTHAQEKQMCAFTTKAQDDGFVVPAYSGMSSVHALMSGRSGHANMRLQASTTAPSAYTIIASRPYHTKHSPSSITRLFFISQMCRLLQKCVSKVGLLSPSNSVIDESRGSGCRRNTGGVA